METPSRRPDKAIRQFCKHWQLATDDNNLTLYGFRRFKTTYLLNLRYLEDEIAELDHTIYQAGLSQGLDPALMDRLGLTWSKRDANVPSIDETITRELVLKLRDLLKQYDEALAAFHNIMIMETFSLLDDERQSSLRSDLTLYEMYNTQAGSRHAISYRSPSTPAPQVPPRIPVLEIVEEVQREYRGPRIPQE